LPGKNIKPLAGTPLIGHAVRAALAAEGVSRCVVSTDDPEIAETARKYGAEIPFMRPAELATDRASEWLAWRHAISTLRDRGEAFDVFLSVPTTAPLRIPADIEACIADFGRGGADMVITVTPSHHNPYFNMVTLGADGAAELAIRPQQAIAGRQGAPQVYAITTVAYVADPDFVLRAKGLFDGRVRAVTVPQERAIDIDTGLDFRFAELLMEDRQKNG
jgi:N-acylneuraminate cytidylyltransferase